MSGAEDAIRSVKDKVISPLPQPSPLKTESSPQDLKSRLKWGEPALTIIDIRSHDAFNQERIMGAINMEASQIVELAKANFEATRDLYLYGDGDQEASQCVSALREAGYTHVAMIKGGLAAWKAIDGSTEGPGSLQDRTDVPTVTSR